MNITSIIPDKLIEKEMDYWQIPGLSLALIQKGQPPLISAFGRRNESGEAVTSDTLFCIASCTKAMTSAVIAMLVSEGKLCYDEPISSYLSNFSLADDEATQKITLRDILCHRTGLASHDGIWPTNESLSEFVSRFAYLEPAGPFRSGARYSNILYALAGHIAEIVSGKPYSALMNEYLFAPLGMSRTSCNAMALKKDHNHAEPFQVIGNCLTQLSIWNVDTVAPAASINTNSIDMAKWLTFIANGGVLPSGKRLIEERVFYEMITKQIDYRDYLPDQSFSPTDGYAFGWQTGTYFGRRIIKHTGKIEGYSSIQMVLPDEGIGLSIMMNLHSPSISPFHAILYTILDPLLGCKQINWPQKFHDDNFPPPDAYTDCNVDIFAMRYPNATPRNNLCHPEKYQGGYFHPGYGFLSITENAGVLYMSYRNTCLPLQPYWGGVFKVDGFKEDILTLTLPVRFIENLQGEITAVQVAFEPTTADILFWRESQS